MTTHLAYLGPVGTYSEQAALLHNPDATLAPFSSIHAVGNAVVTGLSETGIVPIENSLEGSVPPTLDLIVHEPKLLICSELVIRIEHCLLAMPKTNPGSIEAIYSHPQALAQCRKFLDLNYPNAQQIASLSTASAVEKISDSSPKTAAIGNRRSAMIYGAEILSQGIEDSPNNFTRFIVLALSDHDPTGSDKTSVCFDFEHDSPGILVQVLTEFAKRGVNLAKIESRPTKRSLGRYVFLVDLEGHRQDDAMIEALNATRSQVSTLKVLGSYPMHVSSAISD